MFFYKFISTFPNYFEYIFFNNIVLFGQMRENLKRSVIYISKLFFKKFILALHFYADVYSSVCLRDRKITDGVLFLTLCILKL